MDIYFSISYFGKFVLRTDVFSNDPKGAERAEIALNEAFGKFSGYEMTRYERPSAWTTKEIF